MMPRFRRPIVHKRVALIGGAGLVSVAVIIGFATFTALGASPPTRLPQSLTNPNLPFPTDVRIEPTHAALLHRDATARVEAATTFARNPPTKDPHTPTPIPTADHPGNRPGIISEPLPWEYGPAFRNDATIENFYRTFPDNRVFVVAAGAAISDRQQGFVGTGRFDKTGLVVLNESPTPAKHGSVHITAVNGSLVTLIAKDGTTFTFDYNTYAFK